MFVLRSKAEEKREQAQNKKTRNKQQARLKGRQRKRRGPKSTHKEARAVVRHKQQQTQNNRSGAKKPPSPPPRPSKAAKRDEENNNAKPLVTVQQLRSSGDTWAAGGANAYQQAVMAGPLASLLAVPKTRYSKRKRGTCCCGCRQQPPIVDSILRRLGSVPRA